MKEHTQATRGPASIVGIAAAATLGLLAMLVVALLHPGAATAARSAARPVVSTATTSLGRILVDSRGRTVYLFQKDTNGKSACAGQCATFWPPLIAVGKPVTGAGAKASLVGTTKRADGRVQLTYDGHPLYTFANDSKRGQTSGEGVNAFGGSWYVVSPAGSTVVKQKTTAVYGS